MDVSVFLAIKHASKAMMKTSAEKLASGGSIIATASTAGIRSGAGPSIPALSFAPR
jgi:NAD(P)-dependent dehydrogenase (short-subunit alcohol dehydrogenase family)